MIQPGSEPPAPDRPAPASHVAAQRAVWFVVVASLAFATSSPLARFARPANPLLVACGRVALAGCLLALSDLGGLWRVWRDLSTRHRLAVAGAGGLLGAHFGLFLFGLDHTSLPAAVSLVALEPIAVVSVAWFLFGVRPGRMQQLGLIIATAGVVVMSRAIGQGEHRLLGDVCVLVAAILYAVYVAAARGLRAVLPSKSYAALVYLFAGLSLAPVVLGQALLGHDLTLEPHSTLAIIGLALCPTLIGHTFVQIGARSLSPAVIALVSPGEALGSLILASWWLHTVPSPLEQIGAAVILLGTVVTISVEGRAASN